MCYTRREEELLELSLIYSLLFNLYGQVAIVFKVVQSLK